LLLLLVTMAPRYVMGATDATTPPGVAPEYQKFFRYYKVGRSLPTNVLQAHGINDEQIGRSYALIAGVSLYPNLPADKRSLEPAKHDIENLVSFLRDKQFFDEIIVLEDGDVNLANFNYFLQVYLPKQMSADKNARFLFAYSGHGFDDDSGSSYILTSSASSMSDLSGAIDLFQLKIAIEKVVTKALNSIILINSCQGGAFLNPVPVSFGPRLLLATFGAHAITAGAKGQPTYGSGAGHTGSYFFDEVVAGLSGGADFDGGGLITADQLYSFVRTQVQRDTNQDQDPQFGDIAPTPRQSRGSFFFVDPSPDLARVKARPGDEDTNMKISANIHEPSCGFALFSDYYAYALSNNLQDDILRLVDAEDWRRLQELAGGTSVFFSAGRAFLGGNYSLSDDYFTFDQKRSAHFKNVLYNRSIQQAADLMQLTMSDRVYNFYGDCLSHEPGGWSLRAWAARETIDDIELHLKYLSSGDARGVDLSGSLTGGAVNGASQGKLLARPVHLRPNQERVITIRRNDGDSQVHVVLNANDDGPPLALTYRRADGILSIQFVGTAEILREANHRIELHTPNNNENRGNCPNEVGHHDGKYCTSRTTLTFSTKQPRFLKNARLECAGAGCPWTQAGVPVFSPDQSSVSVFLDNWGSDVQAILIVDEYEHVSAQECANTGSVPAVSDRPILFAVSKDCVPFAAVKWVRIPSFAEGIVRFGSQSTEGQVVMNGTAVQGDATVIASYSLTANPSRRGELSSGAPGFLQNTTTEKLDYQALYDAAKLNEAELASLGEAAFRRGDFDWTIKCLEQARLVQRSKVWMGRYPFLAASYLLGRKDKGKFEQTLEEMLQAMTVPNTYLYHAFSRSAIIEELNTVLGLVPSEEQPFVKDVIKRASAITTG
jgi:hypothetical protein